MTHTGPIPESEGTFREPEPTDRSCRKCGERTVTVQLWDSNDGAYVDAKYTCACGHTWWVDGIDS